jgi:hypothetical protein
MRLVPLFIILIISYGCTKKGTVNIWIENSSDIKDSIYVKTFIGDSLVDQRQIYRDSIADRIIPFAIHLPKAKNVQYFTFRFVALPENSESSTVIRVDSIEAISFLHVNYVETLFKKGYVIFTDTLKADSIIRKDFYSEIVYKR